MSWLARQLHSLANILEVSRKAYAGPASYSTGLGTIDAYRRRREPAAHELLRELKSTAYSCASINASVCADFRPRLYVSTAPGETQPRAVIKAVRNPATLDRLQAVRKADTWQEVVTHPLLTLLHTVNPVHNAFDLLELTTLYQEVTGHAYWLLEYDPLGVPTRIWPLPAHLVRPVRLPGSAQLVDYYEYRAGPQLVRFDPEDIVHFRYPDPADPFLGGLSPLRAAFEQASLASEFVAFKTALWRNSGLPGVILSPQDVVPAEERQRLEIEWQQKFQRGGQGQVLVAESNLDVDVIEQALGDLASLAEQSFSKEEIANAFGVPLPFLTKETNLANLQGARRQHAELAVRPRVRRRDEKINEQLIPKFDPSGRLFVLADDPVIDDEGTRKREELDLRYGLRSINEIRAVHGLDPVAWGEVPWLPLAWVRTDSDRRRDSSTRFGEGSPTLNGSRSEPHQEEED